MEKEICLDEIAQDETGLPELLADKQQRGWSEAQIEAFTQGYKEGRTLLAQQLFGTMQMLIPDNDLEDCDNEALSIASDVDYLRHLPEPTHFCSLCGIFGHAWNLDCGMCGGKDCMRPV